PAGVGLVLTFGSLAGVLTQVPGGALADAVSWKRGLAGVGIGIIGIAALILALVPSSLAVTFAEVLHGTTAGIITPAIGAISLGLVGRRGISLRTGRNYRYAAAGHAMTAAAMGFAGDYFAPNAILIAAALHCVPALIALGFIRPQEIDYARARNAGSETQMYNIVRISDLAKNRSLVLFMAALVVSQLAMLPLVGEQLAATGQPQSSLSMSGLIIIPQIVVALLAPWVGYHSEKRGRRPLLLVGFGLEAVRAAMLALSANYGILSIAQL